MFSGQGIICFCSISVSFVVVVFPDIKGKKIFLSIIVAHISSCVLSVANTLLLMWIKNDGLKFNDSISQDMNVFPLQLVIIDVN